MGKPTYDWDWFVSKTPFKQIMEDSCGLEIKKEIQKIFVAAGQFRTDSHYKIKVDYKMFKDNFEEIKNRLLNTNVCKHSKDVFDYVNEIQCGKEDLCRLVLDGCIANASGSLEWNFCE